MESSSSLSTLLWGPGSVTHAYTHHIGVYIYIYRYRQVSWKNDRPAVRETGGGRCSRGPTKGCMIDRAMACQIMQFYFIWFRGGNCYFGGSAAPNGRRSDVLAWLFLPHCRLPPPSTSNSLADFPLSFYPSVLRYILTPARIIAPRVENSGSITCERRWRIVGSPLFRRQRPRGTINPASSCHLALETRLIARTIDLDRPIYLALHWSYVYNAFCGTENSRWLRSYGEVYMNYCLSGIYFFIVLIIDFTEII